MVKDTLGDEVITSILFEIDKCLSINTVELANKLKLSHNNIIGYVNSIKAAGDVIEKQPKTVSSWELTDEGRLIKDKGSYEFNVYQAVKKSGRALMKEITKEVQNGDIGVRKAMVNKWIKLEKSEAGEILSLVADNITDDVQSDMVLIDEKKYDKVDDKKKNDYKKRKLIKAVNLVTFDVTKGKDFTLCLEKQEAEVTADMIANGSWEKKNFKNYNFDALGVTVNEGHLHPLLKMRAELRQVFLEMGFEEMPTNNYIESSFWNFDALFQPQQHPARDAHDTFFLLDPKVCNDLPQEYLDKVKEVHSKGGYGSQGYKYKWQIEEAKKNLLRTHTTAVSARMLKKIGSSDFKPVKYFSIDRVFRNETLDATHLAEFQQVEGVIADYDLTLGDLLGTLKEFFQRLGISRLKFKPAYNPYTEPSMEVFGYHPGLKKWVEVGNSGMFRPEMLLPMGIPPKVNVIAWGLSLERPTMIKYNINNIRTLVGHKVNLQMVYNNPLCRLENET